jgi:hypothetical protein
VKNATALPSRFACCWASRRLRYLATSSIILRHARENGHPFSSRAGFILPALKSAAAILNV